VPEDFLLANGGQFVFFEKDRLAPRDREHGSAYIRSLAYTQKILDVLGGTEVDRRQTCHVPTLFDVGVLRDLESLLPDEFAHNSRLRFRSGNILQLHFLYSHYLREISSRAHLTAAQYLERPSREYCLIALEPNPLRMIKRFLYAFYKRPKFFCINDHLSEPSRLVSLLLKLFLSTYYPHPSSFEKT